MFKRCREVQADPNGNLDLWAREHYKSTIITFALTIQDILNDPEITVGIFSHTRPIAKGFLRQIKRELEANERLKLWFDDILWQNPAKESPKWSEDEGITVKRDSNPKEATVEAWGLVDGQPTSKHYKLRIYDDVVTRESVTSPDMMKKTTEAWELSDNLGSDGGTMRMSGTRYHFNDTYGELIKRDVIKVRTHPCTIDGTDNFVAGNCVLMAPDRLIEKRRLQGPYTFGSQMLLNPKGDNKQGFDSNWLQYMERTPPRHGLNVYILVDSANEKRKHNDYTCMWVVGLGSDRNYVILDVIRDRLNLAERTKVLFDLHRKWKPLKVGWEKYGKDSDIQHIKTEQEQQNYRFNITELGGPMAKPDRIKRLVPLFEQCRVYLPKTRHYTDWEKNTVDLIDVFVEQEYKAFPVATHDDMLDSLARIEDEDMHLEWPSEANINWNDTSSGGSWLGN